jgi:hypothetical protein
MINIMFNIISCQLSTISGVYKDKIFSSINTVSIAGVRLGSFKVNSVV